DAAPEADQQSFTIVLTVDEGESAGSGDADESEAAQAPVVVPGTDTAEGDVFNFDMSQALANGKINDHPWYVAIVLLLMLAAFTKSAQFPFHFWLPGAMTAPTPASAFLHSATMVKAGIYLLARMHPIMYDHPLWINGIAAVGITTMFISALFALKQRDLKGLLAYSTTSWLGVLVTLIALPSFNGFKALTIGIIAHALYKSALFLSVGSIDHSFGTRNLDEVRGIWKYMPATGVVVILSALSMAGIPLLMGFVAKEVLLDASVNYIATYTFFSNAGVWLVVISAALTGTAGYILIWDVFFNGKNDNLHYHAMPEYSMAGPLALAIGGTALLPFLLEPLIVPLVHTVTPKEFELHLIPEGGFANPYFQLSLLAIGLGLVIFAGRRVVTTQSWQFLPFTGAQGYAGFITGIERIAAITLRSQDGRIRHYLVIILGTVAVVLLLFDVGSNLFVVSLSALTPTAIQFSAILNIMLLVLAIGAVIASIVIKRHLIAALAVGVFGYAVGGIFIVEQAPDVALVQFLIETLATVMIITMIGRISHTQRKQMADHLWDTSRGGLYRDIVISSVIGLSVFLFTLTAVANRPLRSTISDWYIENTDAEVGIPDIVAAIVTDFRGMDTLIEITVFSMAALGVLSLLAVNRSDEGKEADPLDVGLLRETHVNSTPFLHTVAYVVFPIALLLAFIHLFYGGEGPGDGFTAGVVAGLGIAMGYVVFGYYEVRDIMGRWIAPINYVSFGLTLGVVNAALPLIWGAPWLSHWSIKWFNFAGLHPGSTLLFETAIGVTVFGAVGLVMESIAYPRDVEVLEGDEIVDFSYGAPPPERPVSLNQQAQGTD
ncbi:MAG: hydrogen gas-evolving membrane-bound hydrogenase subunit E, partial [Chloroflexota bacterium]